MLHAQQHELNLNLNGSASADRKAVLNCLVVSRIF